MCVCVRVHVRVHHRRPTKLYNWKSSALVHGVVHINTQEGTDILNTPYDRTEARDEDDEEDRDAW